MSIRFSNFLLLSLLLSFSNSFLQRIPNDKSFLCYAQRKYRKIENMDHIHSCKSNKVEEYFNNDFNYDNEINDCLKNYEYVYFEYKIFPLPEICTKKHRNNDGYNFQQNGFSIPNLENYSDMVRYSSELVLNNGEYVYEDKLIPNKGFMISSSAPIGNPQDVINSPQFKRDCGNVNSEYLRNEKCLSANSLIDGKYTKENTLLNFFKNLKFYKVKYVVNLTNQYEKVNDPDCKCIIKADKYFEFDENKSFNIPKTDHITNSGFTVTSIRDDEELFNLTKKKINKDFNDYFEVRQLTVRNEKGEIFHKVNHILFKNWSDHSAIESKSKYKFFQIVDYVREKLNQNKNVLIHCTAGIGRTGTLIASVLTSNLTRSANLNLFKMIIELRKNRTKIIHSQKQIALILENMARKSIN